MTIKQFKKINTVGRELEKVQANVAEFVNQLTNNPILSGRVIEDISVSATATNVSHGLGRDILGWIIINKDADENVFAVTAEQIYPETQLVLTASGAAIISIYVF